MIEQPCTFSGAVPIGRLPDLRHPISVDRKLPVAGYGLWNAVELEGSSFRRMLQHATPGSDGSQCRAKATGIIVDRPAPSGMVDC
jgi:hypothetical protein